MIAAAVFSSQAAAFGRLSSQEVSGINRYCHYSAGESNSDPLFAILVWGGAERI